MFINCCEKSLISYLNSDKFSTLIVLNPMKSFLILSMYIIFLSSTYCTEALDVTHLSRPPSPQSVKLASIAPHHKHSVGSRPHLYANKSLTIPIAVFAFQPIKSVSAGTAEEALSLLHGTPLHSDPTFTWIVLLSAIYLIQFKIFKFLGSY